MAISHQFRVVNSQFTRITSIEQRRRYKTEFDNDYSEYMLLHAENERVSKRFANLEESLKNEVHNDQKYKVNAQNTMFHQSKIPIKRKLFFTGNSTENSKRI